MKKLISNLLFVCYIVLFSFFIGEMLIRVCYKYLSNYNMEMWRYAAELKLPMPYSQLPFHHFPNKKGHYYGVDININSLGFRDREYTIEKTKNKKRIIFLGDSHTFGWGVPFEGLFTKQLEKMLNKKGDKYEVINMGVGNYNSTMELELFKLKGLKLDPDMVILMYFINDVEPIPRKKSFSEYFIIKHSYFFAFLFDRFSKSITRFDKNFTWDKYYSALYSSKNSQNLASNRKSIKELVELCKKNNIEILIVNIPELHMLKEYPFPYATEYIRGLAKEEDVPFLDLLPSFTEYEPKSLWVSLEDPHVNAKAHAIIAQQIYKEILQGKYR